MLKVCQHILLRTHARVFQQLHEYVHAPQTASRQAWDVRDVLAAERQEVRGAASASGSVLQCRLATAACVVPMTCTALQELTAVLGHCLGRAGREDFCAGVQQYAPDWPGLASCCRDKAGLLWCLWGWPGVAWLGISGTSERTEPAWPC